MEWNGILLKGIGGFYYALLPDGRIEECKARGRFRNEKIVPTVGDRVVLLPQQEGHALLSEILPRKNALVRPPVANIDQLVIVAAASAPKPDWLLIDKLIVEAIRREIRPVLVLNKLDEQSDEIVRAFQTDYASAFPAYCVSSVTGEGLALLRERLCGKISCFAGQSAVGKSSILNALLPELDLPVGGLAKKTDRGRHTTRHAELWPFEGGAVLDTPGFSLFDPETLTQEALDACYPEFGDAPTRCRFAGCSHLAEPDCAVKALLDAGTLSRGRYARYTELCKENEARRKHQYD